MNMGKEAIKRWDIHAEELTDRYTSQGDLSREVLINSVLFTFLGPVTNKKILDAGCGEGYLSRILAEKGADVIAVDYSQKMLEIARRRTPAHYSIVYYYGNCEDLDFLESETFDIIVSNMVLQDLPGYKKAINEMYRLLVKTGVSVVSIIHPCFGTPGGRWVKDDTGKKLYWKVDQYFNEIPYEQPYPPGAKNGVLLFHRTLTSYFNTIKNAGFTIEELNEPKPSEEMMKKYPAFKDDWRMSQFLIFKLRK